MICPFERITLYNQLGRYTEAKELIAARNFHPWEGGEGKITGQYVLCRIELAKIALSEKSLCRCFSPFG